MWRRHRGGHTDGVRVGTDPPMGMRFGPATQSLVDWMARHAAADTLNVDRSAWEYVLDDGRLCAVGDWLHAQGVPAGWLRLQAGRDAGEVVFGSWADSLMRVSDTELALLERIVNALQRLTDSGVPWGAASAHVLLMLADFASLDGLR